MSKNVLIISGSPRKGGNTDILVEAFAKGAQEKNHQVTIFNAGAKKIQGCKGCDTCWSKGRACSFADDFTELEPLLEQADVLVFASPLYWFTFSAQIKAAIDKIYAYSVENVPRPLSIKESVLLVCAGAEEEKVFAGIIGTYEGILDYTQWENRGILTVPRVLKKGDIRQTTALQQAEDLGKSL